MLHQHENTALRCPKFALAVLPLLAAASPAHATDYAIPLNCNWNGMAHVGETGQPDSAGGFRSIADRALYIDSGNANALGTNPIVGSTGMHYIIITSANVLDSIHLGD